MASVRPLPQGPSTASQDKTKLAKKLGQKRKPGVPESSASTPPSESRPKVKKVHFSESIDRSAQVGEAPKPVEKKPVAPREDQAKQQTVGMAGKKSSSGHEHAHNPYVAPVADFLRQHGPVPLLELTQEFKKWVKSKEDKDKFIQGVRKVAVYEVDPNDPSNKILRLKT